eukprot:2277077-Pyramimonas_sp.AAC.1
MLSHSSHAICWSRHQAKYFCWQCGAPAGKHLSSKMVKTCEGWPSGKASQCALKTLVRKKGWPIKLKTAKNTKNGREAS